MARTPGTTDGFENNVDVSIVEAKVLKIMRSKHLGIGIAATSQNPTQHSAGLAIYRVPEMVQSQDYVYADRDNTPDQVSLVDREVLLNKKRTIKYEIETFDMSVMELAGGINAEYAAGISTAMISEMDAEFIQVVFDNVVALGESTDLGKTGGYIINANYSTARTDANINTMFFDTVDLAGALEGTVDRQHIGTDKEEQVVITNTTARARFIKGGNGGDVNYADRKSGNIEMINGIALREHPFIGKLIAAGTSFSKDKTYDFTLIEALFVHTEAVAMPFAMNKPVPTTGENSGNPKMIVKFRYGVGVVRPALLRGILNAAPAAPVKEAAEARCTDAVAIRKLNAEAKKKGKAVKGKAPKVQENTETEELEKDIKETK